MLDALLEIVELGVTDVLDGEFDTLLDGELDTLLDGEFDTSLDGELDGSLDGVLDGSLDTSRDGKLESSLDIVLEIAFEFGCAGGGGTFEVHAERDRVIAKRIALKFILRMISSFRLRCFEWKPPSEYA